MSRTTCSLYPIVDGKPSILYKEIEAKTKHNRPLTNLIYALSLQDEIKGKFSRSDLNSQGEPLITSLAEKLGLEDILQEADNLETYAKQLGAVNTRGKTIYYENPSEIFDRVKQFNENNDKVKAVIKYSADGYYIDVDTINSDNFNVDAVMQNKEQLFSDVIDYLNSIGLNTTLSEESEKILNTHNIYYAIDILRKMKRVSTNTVNIKEATLLVDLFYSDPLVTRLINQLGDELPQAISQVSGQNYQNPISLTPNQESQITNLLAKIDAFGKRHLGKDRIDGLVEGAQINSSSETMGADNMSIKDTLKELYTCYHINQDLIAENKKRLDTVSEAAQKLIQTRLALFEEAKLRDRKTPPRESILLKAQKAYEQENYLHSIALMLKELNYNLERQEVHIKKAEKQFSKNSSSLQNIRRISNILLEQLDLVEAHQDILEYIAQGGLKLDSVEDPSLLEDIVDIANDLLVQLRDLKVEARRKQYDVVYAFLKLYWGDTNKNMLNREEVSLEDIMKAGVQDPNIFERFLYSVATSSDEMLNLIATAVKKANNRRDDYLRDRLKDVRTATKELYDSGSTSTFMYEKDKNGYPSKIISDYDYAKYNAELEAYMEQIKNDPNIERDQYQELRQKWVQDHSKTVTFEYTDLQGKSAELKLTVPIYDADRTVKERLTEAQYKYYMTMMSLRAEQLSRLDNVPNNALFDVIEIGSDAVNAIANTKGNPKEIYKLIKNKLMDGLVAREDDTSYGSILDDNNLKLVHTNYKGEEITTLPLFYTREIKDRSRVSTDFSRSMIAYLATTENYLQMNDILDVLLLAKDYMLTQRSIPQSSGDEKKISMKKLGKQVYVTAASKLGISTDLSGLTQDFYEKAVYGRAHKDEGYLWGTKIKVDKLVNAVTGYTSITGLAVNVLGAQANVLVGKLQMLIDSGMGLGGEFFGFKDLVFADAKYFQMLPELLVEVASTTKSSKLGLLMERFDVLDDFYEKLNETGFYKSPLSKILGNTNLFFLYGIGEHLLHAQGMLAILHNRRNNVLDDKGNEVSLLEAFDVEKDELGNGTLKIKDGYTNKDGSQITHAQLEKIKGKIAYANRSMHGAFGSFEKGMIHRYAVGRLIMNFRQWMPAHYARRFRGAYYDPDLGEYREGYYISAWKFVRDCGKDLARAKIQWGTRWKELTESQQYNLRRAAAEVMVLAMLSASIALLGDYKDKKGNWAYRELIYTLKRLEMETMASTPVAGYGFVSNIIKVLNSPMAALNTFEKLSHLLKLTDLFVTIENGRYKGENLYLHNMEKDLPFYHQIVNMMELGESDNMFLLFE